MAHTFGYSFLCGSMVRFCSRDKTLVFWRKALDLWSAAPRTFSHFYPGKNAFGARRSFCVPSLTQLRKDWSGKSSSFVEQVTYFPKCDVFESDFSWQFFFLHTCLVETNLIISCGRSQVSCACESSIRFSIATPVHIQESSLFKDFLKQKSDVNVKHG